MKPVTKTEVIDAYPVLEKSGPRDWCPLGCGGAAWGKHARYLTENHDLCDIFGEDFIDIGQAFEKENDVNKATLGNAPIRCMQQRKLVDFAVRWIEENR